MQNLKNYLILKIQIIFTAGVLFGAYKSSSSSSQSPIVFDQVLALYQNSFNKQNYAFSAKQNGGLYFVSVSIGVNAGDRANVQLNYGGNSAGLISSESTNQNGVIVSSANRMFYFSSSIFVSTSLDGSVQSSVSDKYTTFSAFSILDFFSQESNLYAMIAKVNVLQFPFSATEYTLPLESIQAPRINLNIVNGNAYECKVTGQHVFVINTKVGANRYIRLALEGLEKNFEISRLSTNRNGANTYSRTVVAQCNQGTTVTLTLKAGELFEREYNYIGAFLYKPNEQANQIWGLYKSYSSNADSFAQDPFLFDQVLVNPSNLYVESSRTVVIQVPGYYYLHVSAGTQRGKQVSLRLVRIQQGTRQEENIFYIRSTDTTFSELFTIFAAPI